MRRGKLLRGVATVLMVGAMIVVMAAIESGHYVWADDGIERESPRRRQMADTGFFKKRETSRTIVEITVTFYGENVRAEHKIVVNGQEKFHDTLKFDPADGFLWNFAGLRKIRKSFFIDDAQDLLTIRHEVSPQYAPICTNKKSRIGDTVYELKVAGYCWTDNSMVKDVPVLAQNSFYVSARPWVQNPDDPAFRVQTVSIPLRHRPK